MKKFNVWKFIQFIIVMGIILDCGLYFNYLNKRIIKEKEIMQAKHNEEVKRLEEENEKHIQKLVSYETKLEDKNEKIETLTSENYELKEMVKSSRGESDRWEKFTISFYDLSVASCGKKKSHPAYGLTASGFSLKGLDWESARTIATDPKVIPTGSKVMIRFIDEKYSYLSGEYTARDTGSAIKNRKIDLYVGEDAYNECMDLGITEAYVQVIK
jgi:3D (Asp-Asp-Asp) domain-containing protein